MAKQDKPKKPRPDKYAEKVKISIDFEQAMRVLASKANKVVREKNEHSHEDHEELAEA